MHSGALLRELAICCLFLENCRSSFIDVVLFNRIDYSAVVLVALLFWSSFWPTAQEDGNLRSAFSIKEGGCMLCVWTSPPSKVPALGMSAPVVVNQYPMWVVFQQQAAQAHRFGAKERRTAIASVAVHGAQDGSAQTHMPIAKVSGMSRGLDPGCLHSLERPLRLLWEWCSSAVFICRPHSCLLSAIDMARPRGCALDSLPSFYGYNGRQVAP